MTTRRNTFGNQSFGMIMQPIQLSLVVGKRGSGVNTLLDAFCKRVDMQDMVVDRGEDLFGRDCITAIAPWLRQQTAAANHIVLASSNPLAPRHLLQTLADNPDLSANYRLNAVTAVARATLLIETSCGECGVSEGFSLAEERSDILEDPQLRQLFAIADRIVLTHTDQTEPDIVKRLASTLKAVNPPAPILRARHGDLGPARLVDSGLFDPINGSIDIDRWLCEAAFGFEASRRKTGSANLNEVRSNLGRSVVRFFAVTIDQPLDSNVLSVFLKLLLADRGADLLRLKGIIATKDDLDRPALIDGRAHLIQPLLWLPSWPTADHRSRLVFTTADTSEEWISTLLTTLSDQLMLREMPDVQLLAANDLR